MRIASGQSRTLCTLDNVIDDCCALYCTYVLRLMVGFGSRGSVSHVKPTKTDNMIKTKIINRHIRMALNLSLVNILP